jgi:glucosamine--fructose-6-phosphate aminotransferase (isomerizing)
VVVALSQSGRTPDVVSYVERARERGTTVALTKTRSARRTRGADAAAEAGERSVAASKTFFNQLAALALLAGQRPDASRRSGTACAGRGDLADAIPELESAVMPIATAFASSAGCT